MTRVRSIAVWMALLGASSAMAVTADDFAALGDEIVEVVRENFMDAEHAESWATRYAGYAGDVRDSRSFAARTNEILSALKTSHTHYYPRGSSGYWGLLGIFGDYLEVEPVEYESIGADLSDEGFVRRVLAGGPAEEAGLLRGDRLVAVDDRPFDPVDTFAGKTGTPVRLTIERVEGTDPLEATVIPRRVHPREEWVAVQREGAQVFSRDGVEVGYIPLLWCVGDEVDEMMRDLIAVRFRDADALILDFRDGWGGCNPDFLNFFNDAPPVLTLIDREGQRISFDPQWRKPLFVLINGGSRSGKEVVAHAVQRERLGTLVGVRTAGFVVGGRPFLLSDGSVLYLAVTDALVDGERLEGVGVAPDEMVPDQLEYAAGADPQLERALDLAVAQGQATIR